MHAKNKTTAKGCSDERRAAAVVAGIDLDAGCRRQPHEGAVSALVQVKIQRVALHALAEALVLARHDGLRLVTATHKTAKQ